MKLINPTESELNAAFAREVAKLGAVETHWGDDEGNAIYKYSETGRGPWKPLPPFTRSADAVLPWLNKIGWSCDNSDAEGNIVRIWGAAGQAEHFIHTDKSFPRAAGIALLRANGVEVEFTEPEV